MNASAYIGKKVALVLNHSWQPSGTLESIESDGVSLWWTIRNDNGGRWRVRADFIQAIWEGEPAPKDDHTDWTKEFEGVGI